MEIFEESFLNGLSDDPKVGLFEICKKYQSLLKAGLTEKKHHLEAYALAEAFIKTNEMNIDIPQLPSGNWNNKQKVIATFLGQQLNALNAYIESDEEEKTLQNLRGEFSIHIGKSFAYEFSDGDLERIQLLLNELRDLVSKSELFSEQHQRRLLNRLEKLQQELHKKQSDLDHFWGLVGDAGVVLGKFGKDSKPFVDRIKEVTNIVWRTQSRAEELPSDAKPALLSNDSQ